MHCSKREPSATWFTLSGLIPYKIDDRSHLSNLISKNPTVLGQHWPKLKCRPIGAQYVRQDVIALMEFEEDGVEIRIVSEKQYQLVPPDAITREDLIRYRQRLSDDAGS